MESFEVQRREPVRWSGLIVDAGLRALTNRVHLLAGLPQRDEADPTGVGIGEKVEALNPGWRRGAGELLLDNADGMVESFGTFLASDDGKNPCVGRSCCCPRGNTGSPPRYGSDGVASGPGRNPGGGDSGPAGVATTCQQMGLPRAP